MITVNFIDEDVNEGDDLQEEIRKYHHFVVKSIFDFIC